MNDKPFKLGILVGRFQTIHSGHEYMIETAISLCRNVGIFIGSAGEERTEKNPFSYKEREEMLKILFGDKVKIYPLFDIGVGNNSNWGDYVLDNAEEKFCELPDLIISGKEDRRVDWFSGEKGKGICEMYIPKTIDISASEMRETFIKNDKEKWQSFTNRKLWNKYEELRKIVLESKDNTRTKSI